MNYIRQFNKNAVAGKSLIRKALDSSAAKGQALVPEKLEQVITNTVLRLSPELAMVETEFDNQKFHEFNRLTALPSAGGGMGENAVTPTKNSTYARDSVALKIIRRKGAVTNFLQDTSAKYIDASAAEMENHILAHAYDLATYTLYGNAEADAYTHSGLDTFISTNRFNQAVGGIVPTDLSFLDELIDENLERQGEFHKKCIVMSPKMLSLVSRLLTNVRLNQGIVGNGLTQVDVGGGWRLNAYRDIPIIASTAVRPKAQMGVIGTATAAGVGGASIPDSTQYFFRVAPVTYNGEELASAEVNQTTGAGGGNDNTITLSWTAHAGALYYKIYVGTATGVTPLRHVISAFTYDAQGTITGDKVSHVFTSAPNVASASAPAGMRSDVPLVATGGVAPEAVFFWDLDKYQGLGKYPYTNTAGSRFEGLVTVTPLAITDDNLPFLLKTYGALCPSYEATSAMVRGLRPA